MIEALLLIGFTTLLGGGAFTVWKTGLTSQRFNVNPELEAPEPQRMMIGPPQMRAITAMPKDVRDELDGSTEWWDSQFHKALRASGAEALEVTEGYTIAEKSLSGLATVEYEVPGHSVYSDCTCKDCREA